MISLFLLGRNGSLVSVAGADCNNCDFTEIFNFAKTKTYFSADLENEFTGPLLYSAAPISGDWEFLGVIVTVARCPELSEAIHDYTGLGKTGEIMLARKTENGDAILMSMERFPVSDKTLMVPKNDLENPITQSLLDKDQLSSNLIDYRGNAVIAATRFIAPAEWGIIVKIDKDEALSSFQKTMQMRIIIVLIPALFVIVIGGFLVAHAISRDLDEISTEVEAINRGKKSAVFPGSRISEIQGLSDSVNKLFSDMRRKEASLHNYIERVEELAEGDYGTQTRPTGYDKDLDALADAINQLSDSSRSTRKT
ncbi:MAG: hypothetical protein ABIF92_01705 [archaeon]